MIARTYREYRDVLQRLDLKCDAALEVGAHPDSTSLLCAPELAEVPRRIGIDLRTSGQVGNVPVLPMDARRLAFADDSFDLILCASTLEHIPDFWLACSEMKRVLAPGGTMVVSVPGYGESPRANHLRHLGFLLHLPDWWKRSTVTMRVHEAPFDYYRFSEYALHEVVLAGLADIRTWSIMTPPRIYGMAHKPDATRQGGG